MQINVNILLCILIEYGVWWSIDHEEVSKKRKQPEGKSEKAVQEEQLLLALRKHIVPSQSSLSTFEYERSQEQKKLLDHFKEGVYIFLLCTFRYLAYEVKPSAYTS